MAFCTNIAGFLLTFLQYCDNLINMNMFIVLYSPNKNIEDLIKFKKYAVLSSFIPIVAFNIEELCVLLSRTPFVVYNKNDFNACMLKGKLPCQLKPVFCEIENLNTFCFKYHAIDEQDVDVFVDKKKIYTTSIVGILVRRILKIMLMHNISKISRNYVYFYLNSLGMDHFSLTKIFREYFKRENPGEYKNITNCINELYCEYSKAKLLAS